MSALPAEDQDAESPKVALLSVAEVCARLGISRWTFYDWRQSRKAPPCLVLPNGHLRVRESDLNEWIDSLKDPPHDRGARRLR